MHACVWSVWGHPKLRLAVSAGSVTGPLGAASIVIHMTRLIAPEKVPKMGTNDVVALGHGLQEVSHNDANKRAMCKQGHAVLPCVCRRWYKPTP